MLPSLDETAVKTLKKEKQKEHEGDRKWEIPDICECDKTYI